MDWQSSRDVELAELRPEQVAFVEESVKHVKAKGKQSRQTFICFRFQKEGDLTFISMNSRSFQAYSGQEDV